MNNSHCRYYSESKQVAYINQATMSDFGVYKCVGYGPTHGETISNEIQLAVLGTYLDTQDSPPV